MINRGRRKRGPYPFRRFFERVGANGLPENPFFLEIGYASCYTKNNRKKKSFPLAKASTKRLCGFRKTMV
jgi:hypothetical protein